MIVKDLRRTGSRVSGTIYWETAAKEPFDAFISIGEASEEAWLGRRVSHPFLIAVLLPAMRHGEKRIRVDNEPVDPFLLEQIRSVMALAHAWWGGEDGHYQPVEIEAELADHAEPKSDRVAASFLTGGWTRSQRSELIA
ncbi:hypothetical protein [Salinibacter ruber]|uniref:hypothetical protein n=1 Tax=Salinibacter ruber TaxID=146919 RepID=UPI0013C2BF42|nr:hypothetical protein [Salinibacter ruber]